MNVQLSYDLYPAIGVEGQIATSNNTDVASHISTQDINVGLFVAHDTTVEQGAKLPGAITEKLIGVSVRTHQLVNQVGIDIPNKTVFNVLTSGHIYVKAETAVNEGDPVHVRCVAAVAPGDVIGAARNSQDGTNTQLFVGAKWTTKAAAGSIGMIKLFN